MSSSDSQTVSVVLVPGAFAGTWMWQDVLQRLEAADIGAHAVELATYGEAAQGKTFADDVAAVSAVLDRTQPLVLAAHSYGGAVITAAAARRSQSLRSLIYVAAAAPGAGESMASVSAAAAAAAGQGEGGPGPEPREDGLMVFPPEIARQALFNDCSDDRAHEGLRQLKPQSLAGTDQIIDVPAWSEIPSVYLRGEQDLVPRALSESFLAQCEEVVDLPTGHCPQWSRPELVADLIIARVRAATS